MSAALKRPRAAVLAAGSLGAASAFALGGLVAVRPSLGLAMLVGLLFLAFAMVWLAPAIAVWVVVEFIKSIPNLADTAMLMLIAAAWAGSVVARPSRLRVALTGQRFLIGSLGLFVAWLTLSQLWSGDQTAAWQELQLWLQAAGLLVVVATAVNRPSHLRLVMLGFVVGASVSVLAGWLGHGVPEFASGSDVLSGGGGRFTGLEGDPNYLANALLPAIVFGVALLADCKRWWERLGLGLLVVALTIGMIATQSRGAFVAAGCVLVAAVFVFRRYWRYSAPLIGLVVTVAAIALVVSPAARDRLTNFNGGGAGRSTLWLLAWRIAKDNQPEGIGLNNFRLVSQHYVQQPGALQYLTQVTDSPHLVHNTYLQLLAETGIVGLLLFLAVVGSCLSAAIRAARVFEARGRADLALLARAVFLAGVGALAARMFESSGSDFRLWTVLALGPAMLGMAGLGYGRTART